MNKINYFFLIIMALGIGMAPFLFFRDQDGYWTKIFSNTPKLNIDSNVVNNKPNDGIEISSLKPTLINSNYDYKVYSFNSGINRLDLNFDGLDDYIFVSHINGADYYDYHILADRDVYNFFIDNERGGNLSSYWNIVTKEIPNKKIDEFERDFIIEELLGCNGGSILRIVQTNNNETLLVVINENPNEEYGNNTRVRFNIFKLKKSGEINGSDYIFSPINSFIGESRGCGIEKLGDKDLINAIKKAGF